MRFSQRLGHVQQRAIQLEKMDDALRNRLYNLFQRSFPIDSLDIGIDSEYDQMRGFILDRFGINLCFNDQFQKDTNTRKFDDMFLRGEWYLPYDIFECCLDYMAVLYYDSRSEKTKRLKQICSEITKILEEEKSGYRLLNGKFVPITNEAELKSLEEGSITKYPSVNTHIKKAIALYADRKTPDYENAIKEAISAVESLCCSIVDMRGKDATLARALDKMEPKGISIHPAQKEAFKKLYGYTSDENGIRHGGIDFKNAPSEDAKYMIVVCSAFINFLLEKLSKLEGKSR